MVLNSLQTDGWLQYSQHQTTVESLIMQALSCVWMLVCSAHFRFLGPLDRHRKKLCNKFQVKRAKNQVESAQLLKVIVVISISSACLC